MSGTRRIAMWSGPRNISTTMMRSFAARPDCAATDEPFYAFFLDRTGADHPMREEVLASQPRNWRVVTEQLTADRRAPLIFEKHMCQHMLPDIGLDFLDDVTSFFLIRDPERMVASFADRVGEASPAVLGLPREVELFEEVCRRTGTTPPVVDAADILADPPGMLAKLCAALDIPFTEAMLSWPAGLHRDDGIWAPHWYQNVMKTTGFGAPKSASYPELDKELQGVADTCQPYYEQLAACKL